MNDIEKIKYHIQLLAATLDARENPTASLVISNDWAATDLDAAHDIFEDYDKRLKTNTKVSWSQFENAFRERFGMSYQDVKSVVLAFFRNGQWISVCHEYANAQPCVEFTEIVSTKQYYRSTLAEDRVESILIKWTIPFERNKRIEIAGKSLADYDFILTLGGKHVIIEVKASVRPETIEKVDNQARAALSKQLADEFWLVVDQPITDAERSLVKSRPFETFTMKDFEAAVASAVGP